MWDQVLAVFKTLHAIPLQFFKACSFLSASELPGTLVECPPCPPCPPPPAPTADPGHQGRSSCAPAVLMHGLV